MSYIFSCDYEPKQAKIYTKENQLKRKLFLSAALKGLDYLGMIENNQIHFCILDKR